MKKTYRVQESASYAVIGLGRFGMALAADLSKNGAEVLVLDQDESKVRHARNFSEFAYVTNDLSQDNLTQLGVGDCETVIICIGSDLPVSLLTTLQVMNMGVRHVIAKAVSAEHGQLLEKLGAEVVYPERDMGRQLAQRLTSNSVLENIRLSNGIDLSECPVPHALVGTAVHKCNLRSEYRLNLIALQTADNVTTTDISPDYVFRAGDTLVLIGSSEDTLRFHRDHHN